MQRSEDLGSSLGLRNFTGIKVNARDFMYHFRMWSHSISIVSALSPAQKSSPCEEIDILFVEDQHN